MDPINKPPLSFSPIEPHLNLVASTLWDGYRWRAVFDKLYYRPAEETFHEFLISVIQWTFGKTWWMHQVHMPEKDRHVFVKWKYEFAALTKATPRNAMSPPFMARANGPVLALLSLGYDLFCLQAHNRLPDIVVDRLRKNSDFQGARYEVAVAAIMMRSDFDIRFLDEEESSKKHCDFIAVHRKQRIEIGVEAKSRRRPGVIHEPGLFLNSEDARGLEKMIRQAQHQKPAGLPFIIFVDLNLPSSPGLKLEDKPWWRDFMKVLARLGPSSFDNPYQFNAIALTNYSFHFGRSEEAAPRPEWGLISSAFPLVSLDLRFLNVIMETLARYVLIPDEI